MNSLKDWERIVQILPADEIKTALKFVYKEDAKRSLCGKLLRRWMLQYRHESHTLWNEMQFDVTLYGKPFLKHPPNSKGLNFNISHHGEWVACGYEEGSSIGIDIVCYNDFISQSLPEIFNMFNKQLSLNEWNNVYSFKDKTTQLQKFLQLWCLKESYLKATGFGIYKDLNSLDFQINIDSFSFEMQPVKGILIDDYIPKPKWFFSMGHLDDTHCVTCALGPYDDAEPSFRATMVRVLLFIFFLLSEITIKYFLGNTKYSEYKGIIYSSLQIF